MKAKGNVYKFACESGKYTSYEIREVVHGSNGIYYPVVSRPMAEQHLRWGEQVMWHIYGMSTKDGAEVMTHIGYRNTLWGALEYLVSIDVVAYDEASKEALNSWALISPDNEWRPWTMAGSGIPVLYETQEEAMKDRDEDNADDDYVPDQSMPVRCRLNEDTRSITDEFGMIYAANVPRKKI